MRVGIGIPPIPILQCVRFKTVRTFPLATHNAVQQPLSVNPRIYLFIIIYSPRSRRGGSAVFRVHLHPRRVGSSRVRLFIVIKRRRRGEGGGMKFDTQSVFFPPPFVRTLSWTSTSI